MFMMMRMAALCNDFHIGLMLVDNALDQRVNFFRGMCGFDGQRLLHEIDICLADLFQRTDFLFDLRGAIRAVQAFQRIYKLHGVPPFLSDK